MSLLFPVHPHLIFDFHSNFLWSSDSISFLHTSLPPHYPTSSLPSNLSSEMSSVHPPPQDTIAPLKNQYQSHLSRQQD